MAHAATIQATTRDGIGSRSSRRLRAEGRLPGILYGHGEVPTPISLDTHTFRTAVRHGLHGLLELSVNGKSESVVIKDLQYDHLGIEMLHVDFARVSADERVTISVPIHLKGTAKGIKSGGVLEQPVHEIDIECAASKLVDHIVVNIADLDLNQSITVADLVLPEGAKAVADADTIVVHVIKPGEQEEESPLAEASASEPEVIRREKEADEAEE